jgi:hypothetical protein
MSPSWLRDTRWGKDYFNVKRIGSTSAMEKEKEHEP